MEPVNRTITLDDRKAELGTLLDQINAHPERDWSAQRERIVVLRDMIAVAERVHAAA